MNPETIVLIRSWAIAILHIVLVLFITFMIAEITGKLMRHYFARRARSIKVHKTRFSVFSRLTILFIYIIGIFVALFITPALRTLSISLFASAGILAAIIGFASQKAFANIISGIVIAANEPFRVGDLLYVNENYGHVEDITLGHTILKNFENRRIIVPNSIMIQQIIENHHIVDEHVCQFVEMDVSYDTDINHAMRLMKEEVIKHPNFFDNRSEEEKREGKDAVQMKVVGYKDSAITLRAWAWTENPIDALHMKWDMYKKIKERFDKEGVEIPFPYRTLVYKTDMEKTKKKK